MLVVFVVYLFLQNWRATLIPTVAVPVSLIGTFAVFPALGFSVNTLSLFGLVLAIGLVVDDAIVVVEAVEHHIEEGMAPREATLKAMEEVSGPVVSIALILATVFLPVAFMSGIQGRLNKQFALTIAISVLISAFNALTLSPALAAMWLRPRTHTRLGRPFFRRIQSHVRSRLARLREHQPHADSEGVRRDRAAGRICCRRRRARPRIADEFRARRGLRLLPLERAVAARGVAPAHRRGVQESRCDSVEHDGGERLQHDCWFQPADARHGAATTASISSA